MDEPYKHRDTMKNENWKLEETEQSRGIGMKKLISLLLAMMLAATCALPAGAVDDEEAVEPRKREKKKPIAESLPIIAKRDLRNTLISAFSIPDGMKAEIGGVIDHYADRLLRDGKLTQDDYDAFFDRMYAEGRNTVMGDEELEIMVRRYNVERYERLLFHKGK